MNASILHQTDLFRPYIDPDDHWDLACVYALAASGQLNLGGVLLDFPPDHHPGRSPDVNGVAQLSYLTGIPMNVAVGSSIPFNADRSFNQSLSARERAGAEFVLRYLRDATAPAYICIVGSCRDVAIAAQLDPRLFSDKCAGIYLNAGTGHPEIDKQGRVEYNVVLNASAYAAIFAVPCPIYWMPCFESLGHWADEATQQFGTFYRFNQSEVWPTLSPGLRSYFTYSLEGRTDTRYLQSVVHPEREVASPYTIRSDRNMWCTAGFFHMASQTVDRHGNIIPLAEAGDAGVFRFRPVEINCDDKGLTSWKDADASSTRFIFEVTDIEAYPRAITTAMTTLLGNIA